MIDDITKIVALLAICSYVLGLIAVNVHIAKLGVSDFSLIQARYVSTGALILLYLGACCWFWLLLLWWESKDFNPYLTTIGILLIGLFPGFLLSVRFFSRFFASSLSDLVTTYPKIQQAITTKSWGTLIWRVLGVFIRTYQWFNLELLRVYVPVVSAGIFGVSAVVLWIIARIEPLKVKKAPVFSQDLLQKYIARWDPDMIGVERWFWFAFVSIICLLAFLIFFIVFVKRIYPLIPETFGGGEPKSAQLLVTDEGLQGVTQLGIPMSSSQPLLCEPVSILFEGANTYTLELPDARVVQINKTVIVGARMLPKKKILETVQEVFSQLLQPSP